MKTLQKDFLLANHGTVSMLTPISLEAQQWADAHLPADAQRMGGAVAIEHRYVGDIVEGILADGLEVN